MKMQYESNMRYLTYFICNTRMRQRLLLTLKSFGSRWCEKRKEL